MRWKSCLTLCATALLALGNTMVRGLFVAALRMEIISLALLLSASAVARGQDTLTETTPGAGNITVPTGYEWTDVTVQCWSGGGGGGGSYGGYGGTGGGGGAYSYNTYPTLLSGSYDYYIGAGGGGGGYTTNGGAGGNTIWNYGGAQDIYVTGGGGGGAGYFSGAPGSPGLVVAGAGYQGGGGGGESPGGNGGGGGGGSAGPHGPGGNGAASTTSGGSGGTGYGPGGVRGTYGTGPSDGSFPGGGGGGGGFGVYLSIDSGASGANGEIVITYTPEPFTTLALSANSFTLRAMRNSGTTTAVTLSETTGTGVAGFSCSLGGAATISPSAGTLAASGTQSLSLGWNNYTSTGPLTGTVTLTNTGNTANPFNSAGNVISMTGAVVDNRIVTASPVNLGVFHVGTTTATGITTLSTTGDDNYFTRVTVGTTGGSGDFLVTGGTGTLFNSATSVGSRTLSGTFSAAGYYSGSVTLNTTGEGLPGELPQNVVVPYSVQVFSGSGVWNGSSGSWGSGGSPNWDDSNGSGVQAAPGTFAGFTNTDTASFSGSGSVTAIDLTGVNPSLSALSFSNSSYTLSNGSLTLNGSTGTATVTVSSGTQTINTPITLANNATFAINGGALLLNSMVSGPGGFAKSGSGGLTLSGADTLSSTGPIAVTQGTLTAPYGISHGGGGITLTTGATLQAAGQINRAVTGTGTVTATGDLFIGTSTQSGQFNQGGTSGVGGTLDVGGNAVILLSSDTAILGSQTNLGAGGSLTTLNGAQLGNPSSMDSTKVLTATGNATINGNFVNNGVVNGPTGSGQELTFTQFVKGAGSTTGNVEYAASYKVGNSPDAVSVQNVLLAPTATLILEVGGTTAGSQYDQLNISGLATLNGAPGRDLAGRLHAVRRREFRHSQRLDDGGFLPDQFASLEQWPAMEHQQPVLERHDQCRTRALDAGTAWCRSHHPAGLWVAKAESRRNYA